MFCSNKTLLSIEVFCLNDKQRGKEIVRLKNKKSFCMIGLNIQQASIRGWFDCCTNKN